VAEPSEPPPPLNRETAWRILQLVYSPEELAALAECNQRDVVDLRTAHALNAFVEAWCGRLGVSGRPPTSHAHAPAELVARVRAAPAARRFSDTPEGICWFLHQLDPERVDESFMREWTETGQPRIVLVHRDPRDVLLSMVTFLAEANPSRLGAFADHHSYAGIMRAASNVADRLTIALTDPYFPGTDAFERGLWLLRHPQVAKVSYEQLVGPIGGGSAAAQLAAVGRLAKFLDAEVEPATVARKIYNPASHTFQRGRIGAWREHFTPQHTQLFEDRYGSVLRLYGYE
jgi:hypothetical protein